MRMNSEMSFPDNEGFEDEGKTSESWRRLLAYQLIAHGSLYEY